MQKPLRKKAAFASTAPKLPSSTQAVPSVVKAGLKSLRPAPRLKNFGLAVAPASAMRRPGSGIFERGDVCDALLLEGGRGERREGNRHVLDILGLLLRGDDQALKPMGRGVFCRLGLGLRDGCARSDQ